VLPATDTCIHTPIQAMLQHHATQTGARTALSVAWSTDTTMCCQLSNLFWLHGYVNSG
jgi:hypothetical protein